MSGHPYARLTPDLILAAVETSGVRCDGTFIALNSYENRVYQVGVEDALPLIVKFYRPHRWSWAAIEEEHKFTIQLADYGIPVVVPEEDHKGKTLREFQGFKLALYQLRVGRAPELGNTEVLESIGRLLGRIHNVGRINRFQHRPVFNIENYLRPGFDYVKKELIVPADIQSSDFLAAEEALVLAADTMNTQTEMMELRIHGDCHSGNILWTDNGPHFVDFDDCRTGPAIQDLWMMLSGEREERTRQLADLLRGYCDFCDFDQRELRLIESLRVIRMLHHTAWLAQRWTDPAFPMHFPWFNTPRYWEEQIQALREQYEQLLKPPIEWREYHSSTAR